MREPADTTATPALSRAAFNNPGMIGPKASLFYNTKTGATTTPVGLTSPYAMMPMALLPDGKHIVYAEAPAGDAGAGNHSLVTMDFGGNYLLGQEADLHRQHEVPGLALLHARQRADHLRAGQREQLRERDPAGRHPGQRVGAVRRSRGGRHRAPSRPPERLQERLRPPQQDDGRGARLLPDREPGLVGRLRPGSTSPAVAAREPLQQGLRRRR